MKVAITGSRGFIGGHLKKRLEKEGLIISGFNDELGVVESIEICDHPWFVAVQFHPEVTHMSGILAMAIHLISSILHIIMKIQELMMFLY